MKVTIHGVRVELDECVLDASPTRIRREVAEYAGGEREEFSIAVAYPESFTGRVMRALSAIPYGETRTYGDIAATLDTSPVAVGQACGRNPVPLVVPCHRVVAADSLGGFSAGGDDGVELKRRLVQTERRRKGECEQASLGAF
jgi:methylated-DNA-[protein]-cysteine S-methyltransferase